MKLKKLTLKNFRKFKDFELEVPETGLEIIGKNGEGKSTIVNAIAWTLFDRDVQGDKQYSPKVVVNREAVHHLETSALLEFDSISFGRKQLEKWETVRGSESKILTGHTNIYSVNGVDLKKEDFLKHLNEIAPLETLWYCSVVGAFTSLKSEDMRKFIFDLIGGEKSDYELAEAFPEIQSKLQNSSLDTLKLSLKASKKKASEELKNVQSAIKERSNDIVPEKEVEAAQTRLKSITAKIEELQKKIDGIKSEQQAASELKAVKYKEIDKLRQELAAEKKLASSEKDAELEKLNKELSELKDQKTKIQAQIQDASDRHTNKGLEVSKLQIELEQLTKKYHKINASTISETDLKCSACDRAFEETDKEKLIEDFNISKDKKLREIKETGTQKRKTLEAAEKQRDFLNEAIKNLGDEIDDIKSEINDLQYNIDNFDYELIPTPKTDKLEKQISDLEVELNSEPEKETTDYVAKRNELQSEIKELEKVITKNDDTEKRLKELASEEKTAAQNKASVEKELMLLDKIVKLKIEQLDRDIEAIFGDISFQMYELQMNRDYKDVCYPVYAGKQFHLLSKGEGIKAGIEIVKSLQKACNVELPLIVDEAEGLTEPFEFEGQKIVLKAIEGKDLEIIKL